MAEWKVNKSQRVCTVSGKIFEVGDTFFSALKNEKDSFSRSDFSQEIWESIDKSAFFSFWKTQLPSKEQQKKNHLKIDIEAFYTFFTSLHQSNTNNNKKVFEYLLALILIRKRVLRLDEIEKSPTGESLLVFDTRAKNELRIEVPEVTATTLQQAKEELEQIFECNTEEG